VIFFIVLKSMFLKKFSATARTAASLSYAFFRIFVAFCFYFFANHTKAQSSDNDLWSLAPVGGKLRGFELPLHNKEGLETGVIRGREAVILDRFRVRVEDLIYESGSASDKPVFLRISQGIYNRDTNELTSDGFLVLRNGEMEISGSGLTWNIQKKKGSILNNARVAIFSGSAELRKVASDSGE